MKKQYESFQELYGQTMLQLQKYKLKTNLIGCNMDEKDFRKYYQYYTGKANKRMERSQKKIQQLNKTFNRNILFLKGLQLRSLNTMMSNYRRKMDLLMNEPSDYNYAKFQSEQADMIAAIINDDLSYKQKIQNLLVKIKINDEKNQQVLYKQLIKNQGCPKFEKLIKSISKAEVRYFKFYQSFQRSITNMVNQLHSHFTKLSEYYTCWQNLGSSLIFQLKSDKELIIDHQLTRQSYLFGLKQTEQQINYMIKISENKPKLRQMYEDKLKRIQKREDDLENQASNRNNMAMSNRNKRKVYKDGFIPINITKWYQNINNSRKSFQNYTNGLFLQQNQNGFFRYTFQQLHHETLEYLNQLQQKQSQKKVIQDIQAEQYHQRFYQHHSRQSNQNKKFIYRFQKYNVPPQLSFNCWYDRTGSKGYFNILDFPANLMQRKIEYELDRQQQMIEKDLQIKKHYIVKEKRIGNTQFKDTINFGYKHINSQNQIQYLKSQISEKYDPQFLPKPIQQQLKDHDQLSEDQGENTENIRKQHDELDLVDKQNIKQIESQGTHPALVKIQSATKSLLRQNKLYHMQNKQILETALKIQTRQRNKSLFQNFVNIFLKEQVRMYEKKSEKSQQSEIQFRYIQNLNLYHLKEELKNSQLGSRYAVNKQFYIKLQPRIFGNKSTRIKIHAKIIGTQELKQKLTDKLLQCFSGISNILFGPIQLEQDLQQVNYQAYIIGQLIDQIRQRFKKSQKLTKQQILQLGSNKMNEFRLYKQRISK